MNQTKTPSRNTNNRADRLLIGKIFCSHLSAKVVPTLLEEPSCFVFGEDLKWVHKS